MFHLILNLEAISSQICGLNFILGNKTFMLGMYTLQNQILLHVKKYTIEITYGFFVGLDFPDLLLLGVVVELASVMAGSVGLSVEDCFDGAAFVVGSDVFLDVLLG